MVGNMIIAPITGLIIIISYKLWGISRVTEKVLMYIGNHSTNIWLTHLFICGALFDSFIFRLQYPILIYIGTLMVSLVASYWVGAMERVANNLLVKCDYKHL